MGYQVEAILTKSRKISEMKTIVWFLMVNVLLFNCKGQEAKALTGNLSEGAKEVSKNEVTVAGDTIKRTQFVLRKVTGWDAKKQPLTKYVSNEESEFLSFVCNDRYGVLEYADATKEWPQNAYYIFDRPTELTNEIQLDLSSALYAITEARYEMDMSYFSNLVGQYLCIGERADGGELVTIIDIEKNVLIAKLATTAEGLLSFDGTVATFWEYSEKELDKDTICPEHRNTEFYANYVPTEQIRFNVKTGKRTETGTYGCGFME